VTLIERHKLGGDCLNTGCIPSKALIATTKLLSHVRRSKEFGVRSASADFDFAEVMERVRRVVAQVEPHDSAERYAKLGVECLKGDGEDHVALDRGGHARRRQDAHAEREMHRHRGRSHALRAADPGASRKRGRSRRIRSGISARCPGASSSSAAGPSAASSRSASRASARK
jgi:hypothetical protein